MVGHPNARAFGKAIGFVAPTSSDLDLERECPLPARARDPRVIKAENYRERQI